MDIVDNFGTASYKCAIHGYMGGQNNLQFESLFAPIPKFELESDVISNIVELKSTHSLSLGNGTWSNARGGMSENGQYIVVTSYNDPKTPNYSHDYGATWNESTINTTTASGTGLHTDGTRGLYITRNGQYSAFGNPNRYGPYIYYSQDSCVTYNYVGRLTTDKTYFFQTNYVNEDGSIIVNLGYRYDAGYTIHVGYVNKDALTCDWSYVNSTSIMSANYMAYNTDFTKIMICTLQSDSGGTFEFNNVDTSKLSDVAYWSPATNTTVQNIKTQVIASSKDMSVIGIVDYTNSKIWISTDSGETFIDVTTDMDVANDIGFSSSLNITISPDGQYLILWLYNTTSDVYVYQINENSVSKLTNIDRRLFPDGNVAWLTMSNNKILLNTFNGKYYLLDVITD